MAKRKSKPQAIAAPRMSAEDKKWRARDDLRTLTDAQKIAADPSRVKAAQAIAKQEIAALAKVTKK